jgi:parallel beta-helix repeat protein
MDYNVCHEGLIRNNRFENCLSGGHIKGGASNITMERNLFINASQPSWVAFELGGDTGAQFYCPWDSFEVKNLKFYSNIIIGGYRGVALSSARDCRVINNTFYNCGQATMRFLTTSALYPALSGNIVENNLLAFGASAYMNGGIQPAGSVTFHNNLYYSILQNAFNGPYWDIELNAIKDPNPITAGSGTPMFADGPGGDFHLIAGSPAIGQGKPETEPASDFFDKPFSVNARAIGAIELENPVEVLEPVATGLLIFPNPAAGYIELHSEPFEGLIRIYNLMGKMVSESNWSEMIRTDLLPPGMYVLRMGNRVGMFVKR